ESTTNPSITDDLCLRHHALRGVAVIRTLIHWLVDVEVAFVDLEIESTAWVCAYPRLVHHRRPLGTVVGERHQITLATFTTLRPRHLFHLLAPLGSTASPLDITADPLLALFWPAKKLTGSHRAWLHGSTNNANRQTIRLCAKRRHSPSSC